MEYTEKDMNILIVEDEKPLQKILSLYLTKAGFTVLTADDGEEALEILSKKNCRYGSGRLDDAPGKRHRTVRFYQTKLS